MKNIETNKVNTKSVKKAVNKGHGKVDAKVKVEKKKSLLDYAKRFEKKPLFTIDKKDEELVYGSNMMVKLMEE